MFEGPEVDLQEDETPPMTMMVSQKDTQFPSRSLTIDDVTPFKEALNFMILVGPPRKAWEMDESPKCHIGAVLLREGEDEVSPEEDSHINALLAEKDPQIGEYAKDEDKVLIREGNYFVQSLQGIEEEAQ